MRIRTLLVGSGLAPDEIERLCQAYKEALQAVHLVERGNDPLTEIIAEKIHRSGQKVASPPNLPSSPLRRSASAKENCCARNEITVPII